MVKSNLVVEVDEYEIPTISLRHIKINYAESDSHFEYIGNCDVNIDGFFINVYIPCSGKLTNWHYKICSFPLERIHYLFWSYKIDGRIEFFCHIK
jgi:hypothetical protein